MSTTTSQSFPFLPFHHGDTNPNNNTKPFISQDLKEETVEDFAQILLAIKSSASDVDHSTISSHDVQENRTTKKSKNTRKNKEEWFQGGDSSNVEDEDEEETYFTDEEDDLYIDSEEDEDWMETFSEKTVSTGDWTTHSSSTGSRGKRKKAPSGSACEKHKRWKKRCPDDCPMRKAKFRRIEARNNMNQSTEEKKSRVVSKSSTKSTIMESQNEDKKFSKGASLPTGEIEESLAGEEGKDKPSGLTRRIKTASTSDEAIKTIKEEKEVLPPPCKKHQQMNLRCPPGCSKRGKNITTTTSSNLPPSPSSIPSSPISLPQSGEKAPSLEVKPKRSTKRSTSSSGSHEMTHHQQQHRTKRLKYLPRSCDRHKLLHAKCPADCPDRLLRDQLESTKNSPTSSTSSTSSSTEKIHWKKKIVQSSL